MPWVGTTYAAGDRAEVDVMIVAGRDAEMGAARVAAETREKRVDCRSGRGWRRGCSE